MSRHGPLVSGGRADSLAVTAIILAAAVAIAAALRPLRRGIQRAMDRR